MSEPAPEPSATYAGGEIVLAFPYHAGWIDAIRRLRRRRWEPATKTWRVPADLAPELLAGLEAAGAPAAWLAEIRPYAREAVAEAAQAGARAKRAFEEAVPHLKARWPDLFPHQREGVAFLLTPRPARGAILADEMGLGKTRQAIAASHEAFPGGPHLVVCPAALTRHWAREIGRAVPGAEVAVLGRAYRPATWTVLSYDRLATHHHDLREGRWGALILDEAHYVKNLRSRRSRLVLGGPGAPGLADRAERLYLLTGTPVANRPMDLFALLRAIRHPLGDDRLAFGVKYCGGHQTPHGWDLRGASNLEELRERLADTLLRRVKDEVLDLPPKLRTYLPVEVDLAAYRRVYTAYAEKVAAASRNRRRLARRLLLAEIAKLRHAAALAKIPAALELAAEMVEAGEKVVVFSCHRAVVKAFRERFGAACVPVVGGQTAATRQAAVDAFEASDAVRLLVGDVRAAGHGFTLAAATQVLFVDYAWTAAEHLQAEDRAHRIGQTRLVTVTYLSAVDTIDEEVEALLGQKLEVAARLIDGAAATGRMSFLDDLVEVLARKA